MIVRGTQAHSAALPFFSSVAEIKATGLWSDYLTDCMVIALTQLTIKWLSIVEMMPSPGVGKGSGL